MKRIRKQAGRKQQSGTSICLTCVERLLCCERLVVVRTSSRKASLEKQPTFVCGAMNSLSGSSKKPEMFHFLSSSLALSHAVPLCQEHIWLSILYLYLNFWSKLSVCLEEWQLIQEQRVESREQRGFFLFSCQASLHPSCQSKTLHYKDSPMLCSSGHKRISVLHITSNASPKTLKITDIKYSFHSFTSQVHVWFTQF